MDTVLIHVALILYCVTLCPLFLFSFLKQHVTEDIQKIKVYILVRKKIYNSITTFHLQIQDEKKYRLTFSLNSVCLFSFSLASLKYHVCADVTEPTLHIPHQMIGCPTILTYILILFKCYDYFNVYHLLKLIVSCSII